MKKINIIVILLLINITFLNALQHSVQKKHVIGSWHCGFFSNFLAVLNQLGWCEKYNRTPVVHWDHRSLYYDQRGFNGSQNVWEYYFKPVSKLKYNGEAVYCDYYIADTVFHYMHLNQETRDRANYLINKYVRLNQIVFNKVGSFFKNNMHGKKTIGIHLRGTDKVSEEPPVSAEKIVEEAMKFATPEMQFFIASDDQKLIDKIKNLLKPYKTISYKCFRSNDGTPLHYNNKPIAHGRSLQENNKPSAAQLGEDVLIETIILSNCDLLVHNLSNVSTAALYFNNKLKHIIVR